MKEKYVFGELINTCSDREPIMIFTGNWALMQ